VNRERKVLLLLPCTNKKPYYESPSWRYIISRIEPWRNNVDLGAVDCIIDPSTGLPYGIVMEWEQEVTVGKDAYPSPQKILELEEQIRRRLEKLGPYYTDIVAYINVKTYWEALEIVRSEFDIEMLPTVFNDKRNWNSSYSRMSPRGIFYKYVAELQNKLAILLNTITNCSIFP